MLTMFKRLASLIPTPATNKVTLFVSDTGIPSYKDDTGLVTPMSGQPIPAGYIDGLKMEWVSGTQIRFTSGSAYIPSLGRALALAAAVTKTPTLAANTWYHNYVYDNAGTTDVEVSTTVPAAPYSGTARAKTGDTSRRYIGSFRTGAGGAILQFVHDPRCGSISYLGVDNPIKNLLSGGVATTATTVSVATMCPITGYAVNILLSNISTTTQAITGNSESALPLGVGAGNSYYGYAERQAVNNVSGHPVDSAQAISYRMLASTTGGLYVDIQGYLYGR